MKIYKNCIYVYWYALLTMLAVGTNSAFAQVSPLQPPPPSSQSQTQGNIIEKLFSNPAASNAYASLYADPNSNNPYASVGGVPKFNSNFWNGTFNRNIVSAGTVVNGTLEDDLSSKKNKTGDTFSILLPDGYRLNNLQLIPANAKIVGAISTVIPAASKVNGVNGSMQISLQTLVLPDGSSMPISASIMYNPNQPSKFDIKKGSFIPVGEYASSAEYSVIYAAGSLTRQLGFPLPYKTQTGGGSDFTLKKGQLLPVKFLHPIDMTAFINSQSAAVNQPPTNQATNTIPPNGPTSNTAPGSSLSSPADSQVPNFNSPYTAPTYPQNTVNQGISPLNQSTSSGNVLPGNSLPAGPEPF